MRESIDVSVWSYVGASWAQVGDVTYERVELEPRYQDAGAWSLTVPYGTQAEALAPGRLVTSTFRGQTFTWTIQPLVINQGDDGLLTTTLGGFEAISMLGRVLAWPNPAAVIGSQPAQGTYTGPAETVIRDLIAQNYRDRYGADITVPTSLGRGATVTSNPRFTNLLEEVQRLAVLGGVGVRLNLVPTAASTRAELTVQFYVPADKTNRVELAAADGSLSSWELTYAEPTATKAVVGGSGEGAGQYLRVVTTAASIAQAATWGGHREVYVDGPETFDNAALDLAGQDAIKAGAATTALTMEAQEPAGTKAFLAFQVGDRVTAAPHPDATIPDNISAIRVVHESGDPEVTPMFGDPDVGESEAMTAQLIRVLKRDLNTLKINRKRGAL